MKRRKEVGRLDIENPKPKWHKTVYLKDGKLMKTIHDGSFTQEEDEYSEYLCFEAIEQGSTVKIVSQISEAPDFKYSTDGETWNGWPYIRARETGFYIFDTIELENIGDRLYVHGDNKDGLAEMGKKELLFTNFQFTGVIKCFGNIMSLIDYEGDEVTEVPEFGFAYLFSEQKGSQGHPLVSTPDMTSITVIGDGGCEGMYKGCASLTTAASMPSLTTIGSSGCDSMYDSCISLTSAAAMPLLISIGEGGCGSMYNGCTSITAAADMPLLTTIGYDGCTAMYLGCTFAMSDDGTTFNFSFPAPPITTTGDDPQTFATAYEVAIWMDNTTGFDVDNQ